MSDVEKALSQFEGNQKAHLEALKTLVRIPGIAFPGFPPAELTRSADAVVDLLRGCGLENVRLLRIDDAPPSVFGEWCHAEGAPTVLLYAHHDVQPAGKEEDWTSPSRAPFGPEEREGRLWGRGAADDKAGVVVHAAAVASWLRAVGRLPLNVKLLIDGEEEVGSHHLVELLESQRELLKADALVIADVANFQTGLPSITTSLRGVVIADVEVRALRQAVHSGLWGGPIPDPTMALCRMLASLTKPDGTIAIAGIYDRVRPLSEAEQRSVAALPSGADDFRREAGMLPGVALLGGERSPYEQTWRQPALSINAIQASSREDARSIVCDSAWARVGIRIVPDMDVRETREALVAHLQKAAPWGVEVKIKAEGGVPWWYADPSGPLFQAGSKALEKGYGKPAVFTGCGGSIGFVEPFCRALGGIPALLVGVEDPRSNAHSENESLDIADFFAAVRSEIHLFEELRGLLQPAGR